MTKFEERKKAYLEAIQEKADVLLTLYENNNNNEQGKESLRLILSPKNEKEFAAAIFLFSMSEDMMGIINDSIDDNLRSIPKEKNEGYNYLIREIEALKVGKKIDKKLSPEMGARIIYDFTIGCMLDSSDMTDYIAERTGFDLAVDSSSEKFYLYMDQAKEMLNQNSGVIKKSLDECTEEELEIAKEFVKEFHKCCFKGKISTKGSAPVKKILKI